MVTHCWHLSCQNIAGPKTIKSGQWRKCTNDDAEEILDFWPPDCCMSVPINGPNRRVFKGCAKEIGRLRKEGASKPNNRGSSRPPPPVERAQKRNSDLAVVQEGRKWVANEDTSAALRESDGRESSMDEVLIPTQSGKMRSLNVRTTKVLMLILPRVSVKGRR